MFTRVLRKLKDRGRRKLAKPAKRWTRWAHLEIESLETRLLFSTGTWMPRPPIQVGGAANANQDPWFAPLGNGALSSVNPPIGAFSLEEWQA